MKESEAWFLLAELVENSSRFETTEFYTCHILSDLLYDEGSCRRADVVFEIPVEVVHRMQDRFSAHTKNDNQNTHNDNPQSWYVEDSYTGFRTYNPMRVMAYTWLGLEALEEEEFQNTP